MRILPALCLLAILPSMSSAAEKIVIAHRGASGYLPEHTLEAKVLAHAQGAHYIEQDVVMTRDGELVVLHDLTLGRTTDVALRFPGRAREDGLYYVIDFTLGELRQLTVTEAVAPGGSENLYPGRFPAWHSRFGIHTLAEEIELIQGLNATTDREAGIYPELKSPWFHHQEGRDLARAVLEVLARYGYTRRDAPLYLQTFDFNELRRLREELLPDLGMDLRLVQLIAENDWRETLEQDEDGRWRPYDYTWMREAGGMERLARYADGVGPAMGMVVGEAADSGGAELTGLAQRAHQAGLAVHPYTLRLDPGRLPAYAADFEHLLEIFYDRAGSDGVFTDFPDRAVEYLRTRSP